MNGLNARLRKPRIRSRGVSPLRRRSAAWRVATCRPGAYAIARRMLRRGAEHRGEPFGKNRPRQVRGSRQRHDGPRVARSPVKGRQRSADLRIAYRGEPPSGVLGPRVGPPPNDTSNHNVGKSCHDRGGPARRFPISDAIASSSGRSDGLSLPPPRTCNTSGMSSSSGCTEASSNPTAQHTRSEGVPVPPTRIRDVVSPTCSRSTTSWIRLVGLLS